MNKKFHELERIIRTEYKCFNTAIYPKGKCVILLHQITILLNYKIWYLFDIGKISSDEKLFMLNCNKLYFIHYIDYINKLY